MSANNNDKITAREVSDELLQKIDYLGGTKSSKEYRINTNVGYWKSGVTIPAGTTITDIIEGMLNTTFVPTYKAPTLTFTVDTSYEIGMGISPVITPKFTQNDAGPVTAYKLFRKVNGVETQVIDSLVLKSYSETGITQATKEGAIVSYRAEVYYAQGPIKLDADGNEDQSYITAGKMKGTVDITCYRSAFYGTSTSDTSTPNTSDKIRSLGSKTTSSVRVGTKLAAKCPAGTKRVVFAYPANIGSQACKVVSTKLGYDVAGVFTKSTVSVAGANGYSPVNYVVFTYVPTVPFPSEDTYTLEIL